MDVDVFNIFYYAKIMSDVEMDFRNVKYDIKMFEFLRL